MYWMSRMIASDRPISLQRKALKLLRFRWIEEHREPFQWRKDKGTVPKNNRIKMQKVGEKKLKTGKPQKRV